MADLVSPSRTYGLVDILDRVLDKGLVIVGDIKINLANVELLTIQIRLLICSIDKAEQIGLDWWRTDPRLSTSAITSPAAIAQPKHAASAPRSQESSHGS
ncbi:MAG TPA: gas vesicle protein [Gemmatimonadaceae bacterium]|nr:gas vesicle protein [Gemmatimonadaceae bacterium]